jgi:hypothetical protein
MTNDGLRQFVSRPKQKRNTLEQEQPRHYKTRYWLTHFVIMNPCGRHLGVETCRIWYMSKIVYHKLHILDDVFIARVGDSVRTGRSGIESRWGSRFSANFLPGPGAHPVSYTLGTGSFPGVKRSGRGVGQPPQLAPRLKKE